jgi:drug/metabolite transporter (DMT)-like permease
MAPAVLVLLIGAAILHAGWNILLKTAEDPLRMAGRGMVVGAGVLIPAAFLGWLVVGRPPIPTEAWVLAFVSGLLEALYFALLSAAYARGDLSLVYPIARGTAPVLAVAIGIVFLGERLGPVAALGVALLLAGILSLQRPWTILRRTAGMTPRARQAAWLAVATGVAIAAYSAVDRTGVRVVAPWLYAALIWGFTAVVLVGSIVLLDRRGRRGTGRALASAAAVTQAEAIDVVGSGGPVSAASGTSDPLEGGPRPTTGDPRTGPGPATGAGGWGRAAVGGLVTVVAYLLVLVAFAHAPLSAVAPVRESAIVLVSGWGSFRLGEAATRRTALARLGAAAIIVVGAVLLALGR